MNLIKFKVTDVINRTTYQNNIYDFHYSYIVNSEEYGTSDRLMFYIL